MYGFLRSPKWLVGHLVALVAVIAFVNLGMWQLRRLDEVTSYNDVMEARLAVPPAPLDQVLAAAPRPDDAAYRRVTVRGTYDQDQEVLLSTRSYQGRPGHHLLTPLLLDGGRAVIVDRGWVPLELDQPPVAPARPAGPGESVEVAGILFPPEAPTGFGPRAPQGEADYVGRVDLQRLQGQVDVPLLGMYVLAQSQQPAPPGQLPLPAEPPVLDDGPHLGYALQWFAFAAVVAVGYPILLRRTAREQRPGAASDPMTPVPVASAPPS